MGKPGSITDREDVAVPAIGFPRTSGHLQPRQRIGKTADRLGAVGQQVGTTVTVDVALQQTVDAVDLVVHQVKFPLLLQRFLGLLEPVHQSRRVAGSDPVEIPVTVNIHELRVDAPVRRVRLDNRFGPVGSDKQPGLSVAVGNDVDLLVAGEIRGDGVDGVCATVHDVLLPLGRIGRCDQHGQQRQQQQQSGRAMHESGSTWVNRIGRAYQAISPNSRIHPNGVLLCFETFFPLARLSRQHFCG